MGKQTKEILKSYFLTGKYPTEAQFAELIDSYYHKDDVIPIAVVGGLADLLNKKLNVADVSNYIVQETGDAEDKVMSQKAATSAFAKKEQLCWMKGKGDRSTKGLDEHCLAEGELSVAESYSKAWGIWAHAEGSGVAIGDVSHAEGFAVARNHSEHACGANNISTQSKTPSEATLFSVGNGAISYYDGYRSEEHNAMELKRDGALYIQKGRGKVIKHSIQNSDGSLQQDDYMEFPEMINVQDTFEDLQSRMQRAEQMLTANSFYVACPAKDSDDPAFVEGYGSKDIFKQLRGWLLDTTDNTGKTTHPVRRMPLMRNNWLRFEDGQFSKMVAITQAMYDECMTNALYTDAAHTTSAYAAGAYDAEAEWEIDKANIKAGTAERTLYKEDGTAVSHKLRPWETVETKYSIGVGFATTVYYLDNVIGDSGKKWSGIFLNPTIWDGIDVSKYPVAPTAYFASPITTLGGKARSFFFLYAGTDDYTHSADGWNNTLPFWPQDRTYPRTVDVTQVTNMQYARANNADVATPYPYAEGGWLMRDMLTTVVELLSSTKYIANPDAFSGGICSNETPTSLEELHKWGGVRWKTAKQTDYSYGAWNAKPDIYTSDKKHWSVWDEEANHRYFKEQCLESQLAASYAVEIGAPATTDFTSPKTFKLYGSTYYWVKCGDVDGLDEGLMNCRVYKTLPYTGLSAYDADGAAMTFDVDFVLRMPVFLGVHLDGDGYVYSGGGAEMVGTLKNTTHLNNKMVVYVEPDQTQWENDTDIEIAGTAKFKCEDSYRVVYTTDTLYGNGPAKHRIPYTPLTDAFVESTTMAECCYINQAQWWSETIGNKARVAIRFGGSSQKTSASPRNVASSHSAGRANLHYAGSAQCLIEV